MNKYIYSHTETRERKNEAAICGIAYAVAPGSPAVGIFQQPAAWELKFTDTVFGIVGFIGVLSVVTIVFGEIMGAIRNK